MDNSIMTIDFFIETPCSRRVKLNIENYVKSFIEQNVDISRIKNQIVICITDNFKGAMFKHMIKKKLSFDIDGFYEFSNDKHYIMLNFQKFDPITFTPDQLRGNDKKVIDYAMLQLEHAIYHECQHMLNNEIIIPQLNVNPAEYKRISNPLCDEYIAIYRSYSAYPVSIDDSREKLYPGLRKPHIGSVSDGYVYNLIYFLIHVIVYDWIYKKSHAFSPVLLMIDDEYREWLFNLKNSLDVFLGVAINEKAISLRNTIDLCVKKYIDYAIIINADDPTTKPSPNE